MDVISYSSGEESKALYMIKLILLQSSQAQKIRLNPPPPQLMPIMEDSVQD